MVEGARKVMAKVCKARDKATEVQEQATGKGSPATAAMRVTDETEETTS